MRFMVMQNNKDESAEPSADKKILFGLSWPIIVMGLISLFADIAGEMLYPVTPIFLTTILGAPASIIGLVEGCAEAAASFLRTPVGRWSDHSGLRKPFVFWGYLLSAVAKPMIGFAHGWPLVLTGRMTDRLGKGIRSGPRDALLSEAASEGDRGRAFGWHRGMDSLGAVIGPLLALLLMVQFKENLRWIYFVSIIPGLASVALILFLHDSKKPRTANAKPAPRLSWRSLPADFRHYLWGWILFSLGNSSDTFLILKISKAGVATTQVILIYCLYNLVYSGFSPYLGGLSDRLGRKRVLLSGLVIFALVYTGFSLAHHAWQFWILFAVYGLYIAATDGVGKAWAVDLIAKDQRATGLGWLGTVSGISTLFASICAGVLWDQIGEWAPFAFGATLALVSVLVLSRTRTAV
jgi:MFS family permease